MKEHHDTVFQEMIQYSKIVDSGIKQLRNISLSVNPSILITDASTKEDFFQSLSQSIGKLKEESQAIYLYLTNENSFGKQLDLVEEGLNTLHRYAQFLKIESNDIPIRAASGDNSNLIGTSNFSIGNITPRRSPFAKTPIKSPLPPSNPTEPGTFRPISADEERALPPAVRLLLVTNELNEKYKILCDEPQNTFTMTDLRKLFPVPKSRLNAFIVALRRLGRMETVGEGNDQICTLL